MFSYTKPRHNKDVIYEGREWAVWWRKGPAGGVQVVDVEGKDEEDTTTLYANIINKSTGWARRLDNVERLS